MHERSFAEPSKAALFDGDKVALRGSVTSPRVPQEAVVSLPDQCAPAGRLTKTPEVVPDEGSSTRSCRGQTGPSTVAAPPSGPSRRRAVSGASALLRGRIAAP